MVPYGTDRASFLGVAAELSDGTTASAARRGLGLGEEGAGAEGEESAGHRFRRQRTTRDKLHPVDALVWIKVALSTVSA